jgi:hypothetical protein
LKNAQPEEFFKYVFYCSEAESVSDVLKHGPTLQAMKVLVQPVMLFGDKCLAALKTSMDRRPTLNNLPLDPSGGKHKVERPFDPRLPAIDFLPLRSH